jgi:FixJ family two-component response regulator
MTAVAALPPCIHVVDDDAHFLRSLLFMIEGLGFDAVGYSSAEAFWQASPLEQNYPEW